MQAQASLDLETDPLAQLPESGIAGVCHQAQLHSYSDTHIPPCEPHLTPHSLEFSSEVTMVHCISP